MMFQVEEVPPPQSVLLNGTLLKSEVIEQPVPILTPISITESSLAPPSVTQAQLITVPIASAQPLLTSTPTATIKRAKRVDFCRFFSSNLMYFLGISNLSQYQENKSIIEQTSDINCSTFYDKYINYTSIFSKTYFDWQSDR
jgi:hypothetical protein